jgi:hypothetical protein
MPLQSDPSLHAVQLDVFHQLHCLDLLHKLAYPIAHLMHLALGSDEVTESLDHSEHCYDPLGQSLQCESDVATIYWEWMLKVNKVLENLATTHTCKDHEKTKEWVREHQLQGEFDREAKVKGASIRHLND